MSLRCRDTDRQPRLHVVRCGDFPLSPMAAPDLILLLCDCGCRMHGITAHHPSAEYFLHGFGLAARCDEPYLQMEGLPPCRLNSIRCTHNRARTHQVFISREYLASKDIMT